MDSNEGKEEQESNDAVDVIDVDDSQEENNDFDSSAFLDDDSSILGDSNHEKNTIVDEEESDEEEESEEEESDNIWDMDSDEGYEEKETDEEEEEETSDETDDNAQVTEQEPYQVLSKFKEIGIEAKDVDELIERVQGVLQEREIYQEAKYTNKNVDSWKKALNLEDKELVFRNFVAEGATKEEAQQMTESLDSNELLKQKGHEIRVALRGSISREQDSLKHSESEKVAKQQEGTERAKRQLQEHLSKTETMFGFKMGKADKLDKIRKSHFDYIQSGKFFEEVTSSPESIAEAAWFQKNKAQITKALKSKGIQTGKREVLDDINNATRDDAFRLSSSDGGSEFNPNTFMTE